MPKPCMVKENGEVDYYLNEDDALSYKVLRAIKEKKTINDKDLCDDNILPEAFDPQVVHVVAEAVKKHIKQI